MLNEPHRGYIDLKSLHSFDYNTDLHLSHMREYYSVLVNTLVLMECRISDCISIVSTRCWLPYGSR